MGEPLCEEAEGEKVRVLGCPAQLKRRKREFAQGHAAWSLALPIHQGAGETEGLEVESRMLLNAMERATRDAWD